MVKSNISVSRPAHEQGDEQDARQDGEDKEQGVAGYVNHGSPREPILGDDACELGSPLACCQNVVINHHLAHQTAQGCEASPATADGRWCSRAAGNDAAVWPCSVGDWRAVVQ